MKIAGGAATKAAAAAKAEAKAAAAAKAEAKAAAKGADGSRPGGDYSKLIISNPPAKEEMRRALRFFSSLQLFGEYSEVCHESSLERDRGFPGQADMRG